MSNSYEHFYEMFKKKNKPSIGEGGKLVKNREVEQKFNTSS